MNKSTRDKWQVRLAALVIFVLGFAAGALALDAYRSWTRATERGERGRERFFERTLERLKLDESQKAQARQIMADAREQMRAAERETAPRRAEIRRQSDERLQKVMTPEQWQQFQQLKEEMRGRRRGRRGPPEP